MVKTMSKLCQNYVKSTEGQNYVKLVLALLCEPSSCLSACDIKSMPGNASLGLHQWTPLIQNISKRQIGKSSFGHVKTPALQPKIAQTILNYFSDSSVHKFRYVRIKIHAFLCIHVLISFYRGTLVSQSFEHSKRTLLSFCCLFVVFLLSLVCLCVVFLLLLLLLLLLLPLVVVVGV